MKKITSAERKYLEEAVRNFKKARNVLALTGAGVSVESGIDDFRSPGGLWSKYPVEEYGTIDVFNKNPQKAWKLFKVLGKGLTGKKPNGAHIVLAELGKLNFLKGIVTQNIDNLHQDAGSETVVEIHGDHRHLQCLGCGDLTLADGAAMESDTLPTCNHCSTILKPNVVLFGEEVRCLGEINSLLHHCDLLMVIGTSAQVYPAASLPEQVKGMGGLIYEFNKVETVLTRGRMGRGPTCDYFFLGNASTMLELFLEYLIGD